MRTEPRILKYSYFTFSEGSLCIFISENERERENMEVSGVIKTKSFILSGSPVCQGWQTPLADWLVPARMGFAVNRSQLAQSEWKEVAQKGYFVSGSVCEAGAKNKTQSPVHFSLQMTRRWFYGLNWHGIFFSPSCFYALFCRHMIKTRGHCCQP